MAALRESRMDADPKAGSAVNASQRAAGTATTDLA
jgi:hypothetical protein